MRINISSHYSKEISPHSFQEANTRIFGSISFDKTLKDCLETKKYTEIISDYVGSDNVKPTWLHIFVANILLRSNRVNLLSFGLAPTLRIYQVYFRLIFSI